MAPVQLDDELFLGGGAARPPTSVHLLDFGPDLDRFLAAHGHAGDPVAAIGLTLSGDGRQVTTSQLVIRGLSQPRQVSFPANRFWVDVDERITLSVNLPQLQETAFAHGTLSSRFMADTEVSHTFSDGDDNVIAPADRAKFKLGPFSLRAICHIDKGSNARDGVWLRVYHVLYPTTAATLAENAPDAHADPRWPGFRLADTRVPLGPRSTQPWGCPILPGVLDGPGSAEHSAAFPSILRAAIAAIMSTAGVPDGCKSCSTLLDKWEKVRTPTFAHTAYYIHHPFALICSPYLRLS